MKWRLGFAVIVLCVVALWRPIVALSDNNEPQEKVPLGGATLERGCPECNGGDRLHFLTIAFCVNCPPHRTGRKCEECTGLWWPPGDCSQWLDPEAVDKTVNTIVPDLAANQTKINHEFSQVGFTFLSKPVQLVGPNIVHSLAGVVPLGTTEVKVQVVVKALFSGSSCGLRVHVIGLQSQFVETYEAYRGGSGTWIRETAFLTLPVDVSDPILTWSWETTVGDGCSHQDTTEVNVLGAFRGGRSLSP